MNKDAIQECIWNCRKAKIELEHEVLLREMDIALIGIAGLPITIVTLVFQFELWKNPLLMVSFAMFMAVGLVLFDYLRSDRKEKILAKQKELDVLVLEIERFCGS